MTTTYYANPSPVVRRVQAYFAPVNRVAATPVLFDPALEGSFSLDSPPAPWISLGWILDFTRKAGSRTAPVLTGIPAATFEQTRETLDAQVSFHFLSWTKLTMALATGSQHMNVLVPASGASAAADGAVATPAVVIQSGATATSLPMASSDAATFSVGQVVVVDVDYLGQLGFVGSPVSGAYVKTALADVDYVRRVSFNVATVSAVTTTGLMLADALPGGVPVVTAGASQMKAHALTGFVDREGGSFFQEWSALFVMEGGQGERIFFHYPRLQASCGASEQGLPLAGRQGGTLERELLTADFRALPIIDPLDGERVVCYRSFLPAAHALI